jgi:hypothetical protein
MTVLHSHVCLELTQQAYMTVSARYLHVDDVWARARFVTHSWKAREGR